MNSLLNSMPISIKRTEAKFTQVHSMQEYYTRVLENLRPNEIIELAYGDEESRHRAHTSILSAGEKKWGKSRIKTSNSTKDHTIRIWFNPVYPIPELDALEQIKVTLDQLETLND